jgi:Protein of unknown function (DUF2628)
MHVYTVHMRRPPLDPDTDVRFVKEGFSWPAFLFSALWALWNRLWFVAAALFVAELAVNGAMVELGADAWSRAALAIGFAVIVGSVGNDLVRWTLFRRDYLEVALVTGTHIDAAERRFWEQRPHLAADLVR